MVWLKKNYFLVFALVVGIFLRFYKLNFQSMWLDEIHTLGESAPNLSFTQLNESIMFGEQMPPLYFYTIHILFKIFGSDVLVARVFSALVGVAAIYAIYRLGKELANKSTGNIAAILLSINHFHIYYSQEARPYAFFCLFSIIALYCFVRFLKVPTWKNTLWFAVATVIMLYGHFFGLLGLLAIYTVLLYIVFVADSPTRKQLLLKGVAAGLLIVILYIPALKFLLKVSAIKEFWLPEPDPHILTSIYKSFIGNHEWLTVLFTMLMVLYILKYANFKKRISESSDDGNNIINNKPVLSFVLFSAWLIISAMIPFIKSHLSAPVMLDRYFIHLLPVIILMAAIGVNTLRSVAVRNIMIGFVCIFTLINTVLIKEYYTKISKTQYRQGSAFLIENNKESLPVLTSLVWHMSYFFNNDKVKFQVVDKPLEAHITDLMSNKSKIEPFWYIDAHGRTYSLSPEAQQFVDKNFNVEKDFQAHDIWAKKYIPKVTQVKP